MTPPPVKPPAEHWTRLTLRPLPGRVPTHIRLRSLLKAALRSYGFRCVQIEDVPAPAAKHAG